MLSLSLSFHLGAAMMSDTQNIGNTPTARLIIYVCQSNGALSFNTDRESELGCGGSRNCTAAVNPDRTTNKAVSAENESALKTKKIYQINQS